MRDNKPELETIEHCTDHDCIYGHPGGMGTNGGCSCFRGMLFHDRVKHQRNIQLLRAEIRRLRESK